MKSLLSEFRAFVMRGNVLDLAVAVILGAAFGAVVASLTGDVIMPFIAAIFGKADFSELTLGIGDGVVRYGSFLTALVNFLIVAAALFLIIKSMEKLQNLRQKREAEEVDTPAPTDETVLLTEIRDLLRTQNR